jgi:hypothetical protein
MNLILIVMFYIRSRDEAPSIESYLMEMHVPTAELSGASFIRVDEGFAKNNPGGVRQVHTKTMKCNLI